MKRILVLISFIFICLSCQKEFDREQYIENKLVQKQKLYFNKELNKCKDEIEEDASKYVDSLISQWINEDMLDTVVFPSKPVRPKQPGHIIDQWEDPKNKKEINKQ